MRIYSVIVKPVLTEKTYAQMELLNKYTFEVLKDANKTEIAQAFEAVFKIRPLSVNTSNLKPQSVRSGTKRPGFSAHVKKAVVTLPPGTKLNILNEEPKSEEKGKENAAKADEGDLDLKKAIAEIDAHNGPAKRAGQTKPIEHAAEEAVEHVRKSRPIEAAEHEVEKHATRKTKPMEHEAEQPVKHVRKTKPLETEEPAASKTKPVDHDGEKPARKTKQIDADKEKGE